LSIFGKPKEKLRTKEYTSIAEVAGSPMAALTEVDERFVRFADEFEERFVQQGENENRSVEESLDIGWEPFRQVPRQELKRIRDAYLEKYLDGLQEGGESR